MKHLLRGTGNLPARRRVGGNYYWGLPSVPPPMTQLWTPADMTTSLWLDAKTSSSVVLTSGLVSQWLDLSGNNRHASQSNASFRPSYSTDKIVFNNAHYLSATLYNSSTNSFFVVAKRSGSNTNAFSNSTFIYSAGVVGNDTRRTNQLNYTDNNVFRDVVRAGATGFTALEQTRNDNLNIHTSISTVGGNHSYWLNGGNIQSASNTTGTITGTPSIWIGCGSIWTGTPDFFLIGDIYEIIFCNAILNSEERQKVEGYLAHKWGLSASLPSNHFYKSSPPLKP